MTKFNNPRKNKKIPDWNPEHGTWYVGITESYNDYLHNDLVIRSSTRNCEDEPTGYYKTRKLAWEAIKAYKEKNA